MIIIAIEENQPTLDERAVAAAFLHTGMSEEESGYYAEQVTSGNAFEIEAPETAVVEQMISTLKDLDVNIRVDQA